MPQEIINGVGRSKIKAPPLYEADVQAFITAAAIANKTQKDAINDLVLDLKAAGIWTKMKALYPMIGGNATSHKWNLKDPRDLDAAYRLVFSGGWTHSSTGALPNGTTGYANSKLVPNSALSNGNTHMSLYIRSAGSITMGTITGFSNPDNRWLLQNYYFNYVNYMYSDHYQFSSNRISATFYETRGLWLTSRRSNDHKIFQNGGILTSGSSVAAGFSALSAPIFLAGYSVIGTSNAGGFSSGEIAFASIGEGLTDLESNLFYQIIEKFQAALGRNVNTIKSFYFDRNYSNEVNAFIFNAAITNATQVSATNTLVNTLKTAGIWSKMKAVYPMVGGTATTHKFNLVNPTGTSATYSLVFNGGWTHDASGAKPNGSNGYANTFLTTPATQFSSASIHMSYYNVTNSGGGVDTWPNGKTEIGSGSTNKVAALGVANGPNRGAGGTLGGFISASADLGASADPRGYVIVSRTSLTMLKSYKNGSLLATNTTSSPGLPTTGDFNIGANYFSDGTTTRNNWSDRQAAMITFGEGLTDSEVTTLTNAIQAFQTTLGRAV